MPQNIEQNLKLTVDQPTNPSPIIQSLWESDINWDKVEKYVRHMQELIYHHTINKQWSRVKNLQKLLAKSYYAKLLAIREVNQRNQGKLTPGVDNQIYETPEKRWNLSKESFNYLYDKPSALKRVFIPKQNGGKRPLGIPTIHDRIMQMIVNTPWNLNGKLNLSPILMVFDQNDKLWMLFTRSEFLLEEEMAINGS